MKALTDDEARRIAEVFEAVYRVLDKPDTLKDVPMLIDLLTTETTDRILVLSSDQASLLFGVAAIWQTVAKPDKTERDLMLDVLEQISREDKRIVEMMEKQSGSSGPVGPKT